MILIQCITDSHLDNIAACLRLQPERMIAVGRGASMEACILRYQNLLRRRGLDTKITACDVQGKDFGDICLTLNGLLNEEAEYVIDVTGGDETVMMAVGAVLAGMDRNARQRIRAEKYDRSSGTVIDCIHDNQTVAQAPVNLTVAELIALHGGILRPGSYQPPRACTPGDIAGLWNVVSQDPREWNRGIMLLSEFESRSDSKTQVFLPLTRLRSGISNFDRKLEQVLDLLGKLQQAGVIEDSGSRNNLEYTYTSPLLRYCTAKAGNVLEIKTLLEGRAAEETGVPFFQDCQMSVSIDWDGVIYDPAERIPETRNEIDVVLIHGMTPLFISCKNGNIGEEELYKLHTVAARFGGPHARKMLIATDLDLKSPAANRAFIQRAWDMDIFLVTDAAELSGEEWQQIFVKAMQ